MSDVARVRFGVDRTASNPCQALLYRAAGSSVEARPATVEAALAEDARGTLPPALGTRRFRSGSAAERRTRVQALFDGLDALRARGDHVVWSRHEAGSPNPDVADLHREVLPHLTALASVIQVESFAALEAIGASERLDLSKTVVIAQGNYVAFYPEYARPVARRRLELPDDGFVFLAWHDGRGRGPDLDRRTRARLLIGNAGPLAAGGDPPLVACPGGDVALATPPPKLWACARLRYRCLRLRSLPRRRCNL